MKNKQVEKKQEKLKELTDDQREIVLTAFSTTYYSLIKTLLKEEGGVNVNKNLLADIVVDETSEFDQFLTKAFIMEFAISEMRKAPVKKETPAKKVVTNKKKTITKKKK